MLSFVNILRLSSYEVGNAWQIGVAQWYNTRSLNRVVGSSPVISPGAEKESTTEKGKKDGQAFFSSDVTTFRHHGNILAPKTLWGL
jgi:hypothetical protein